jgi:beta-lactam-binding protein with PASTA domain
LQFIKFLTSRLFWLNLLGALIVFLIIVFAVMRWLDSYTKHGETITVPDLRGMSIEQVQRHLTSKNLRFAVLDSLYDKNQKPASVLDQNPKPGSKVKENRTIYITVNAFNPPEFKMPNLVDKSLRQAMMEIESYGLKVGELKYVPDIAQNAVLKQLVNGKEIKPGELVAKGTAIDLILGDGLGNTQVEVPLLLNLTLSEAKFVLTASSLNLGAVIYAPNVKDTTAAVIYKQIPAPWQVKTINMGEAVDVFLSATFPDSLRHYLDNHESTDLPLDNDFETDTE